MVLVGVRSLRKQLAGEQLQVRSQVQRAAAQSGYYPAASECVRYSLATV